MYHSFVEPGTCVWFQASSENRAVFILDVANQCRVVVCITALHVPVLVGPVFYDIRKLRADVLGQPACPKRNVQSMYAQIAHAAVFAVELRLPFPVYFLCYIHVAAVIKPGFYLKYPAELILLNPVINQPGTRIKRKLARTPDNYVRAFYFRQYRLALSIPKGLLASKCFPAFMISI